MKTHHHLWIFAILAVVQGGSAQDIIKANNKHALNLPISWTGGIVPSGNNIAVWNLTSTSTFSDSAALGANISWQGMRVDGGNTSSGKFTISGNNTLTLGRSGIAVTGINLWFENPIVFNADASLQLNTDNKGITLNGIIDLGGHALTVVSNNHNRFITGNGGLTNGSLLFTHNHQVQFNAKSSGPFSLLGTGTCRIIINHAAASNPQLQVGLTDSAKLSLGVAFDNLSFEIGNLSGTPGASITPDYGEAPRKPAVVRTLAVNQTADGIYAGSFSGANNNRGFGLTKNGKATLTLTNPTNDYSGPTTINAGTLQISSDGRLNHRPQPNKPIIEGIYPGAIINNGTLHIDSSATQNLSGAIIGSGTLLKSNTGFLTLAGNCGGFTGETLIQGGRLVLNGPLGGNVLLTSNSSLGGSGTSAGSLATAAGSTLILSGGTNTGGLSFHGAKINGPTYVEFSSPQNDAVVYDVLSYGDGGISGYEKMVARARGTLSHDISNKKVIFKATAPEVRTWNIGDGRWSSHDALPTWAGGDQLFVQGDQVVFDAIDADTTITFEGMLAPSTVNVVNPARTYTFTGSGGLVGNETFTKSGSGILQIANSSPNFAGPTIVNAGIFRWIDGGSWGTSPITNSATLEADISTKLSLINGINGTGVLTKRGRGTLTLAGTTENTFTGNVTIESGRVVLGKQTALGSGNRGAKSVIINPGGQVDLNGYADTQHKEVKKPSLTYTFEIAGDGDGAGAIINTRGGSLRIPIKDLDFAGVLNLELTGDASIGGTAGYDVGFTHNLTGAIIGNGHTLTKRGPNTIHLRAPARDIALIVQEGVLGIENNNDAFGGASGSVTVHANASVGIAGPVIVPTPVTLHNESILRSIPNWYSPFTEGLPTWSGPITLKGIATVLTHAKAKAFIISGAIGGSGGIVKSGSQSLTLTGANTYTGSTTVQEGTLILQQSCLADKAPVSVATGATLRLDFQGTDAVGFLTLGGVAIAPGKTCDATTHPDLLSGTGKLEVGRDRR